METQIVGRVENPDHDFDPIVVPIAAYTEDGEEVIERFSFRPVMPAGAVIRAFDQITPDGVLSIAPIMKFLQAGLMSEDRNRFLEFLDREDLMIEASLISDVYQTVTQEWAARPTRRSSGSSRGGTNTPRTSRGARRSRASTSKTSR